MLCFSICCFPTYVTGSLENHSFDHQKLYQVVKVITRNLDRIIDINYYPVPETKNSNESERPLGIGVQGLADVFFKMGYPYDSKEAKQLNKEIFETIYYAALDASCELARTSGPYKTYEGSPFSKGILQFDLWEQEIAQHLEKREITFSGRWDWNSLKERIKQYGIRNSMLTSLMPTATTSHIMATTVEAFEPINSNIYNRRTLAGEFTVINTYLMNDLMKRSLWTPTIRLKVMSNKGSIQNIDEIPNEIKEIYKTCWEIKQKDLIDMSADRGPFIDQSQSLNLFFTVPEYSKLTSAHFRSWKTQLKTGSYYIHSKAGANATSLT